MSVWNDIRRKSLGQESRIEDRDKWDKLVDVQPMSPPMGMLYYMNLDSQIPKYKGMNNKKQKKDHFNQMARFNYKKR